MKVRNVLIGKLKKLLFKRVGEGTNNAWTTWLGNPLSLRITHCLKAKKKGIGDPQMRKIDQGCSLQ